MCRVKYECLEHSNSFLKGINKPKLKILSSILCGEEAFCFSHIFQCLFVISAPAELHSIVQEVKYRTGLQSAKLIRQLKRRDRLCHKLQKNYDIITACLQAVSQKRRKNTHF